MKNPELLTINLVLRLILWGVALKMTGWKQGDTDYYLMASQMVCAGQWGGDSFRAPFLPWVGCLMSRFGGVGAVLLMQTLLIWGVGVWIRKRLGRSSAMLWLFDPVLLVYSTMFMSEAFFTIAVFLLAIILWKSRQGFIDKPIGAMVLGGR